MLQALSTSSLMAKVEDCCFLSGKHCTCFIVYCANVSILASISSSSFMVVSEDSRVALPFVSSLLRISALSRTHSSLPKWFLFPTTDCKPVSLCILISSIGPSVMGSSYCLVSIIKFSGKIPKCMCYLQVL